MAQAKEVRGPGPRMGGPRPKVEKPGQAAEAHHG